MRLSHKDIKGYVGFAGLQISWKLQNKEYSYFVKVGRRVYFALGFGNLQKANLKDLASCS